jgi:hypothetical protein
MAEMTIRLRCDPVTGKKDVIIALRTDEDALPHEHEQRHRALVDKLIQGGLLKAGELGQIVVERVEEEKEPRVPASKEVQGQRQAHQEGT